MVHCITKVTYKEHLTTSKHLECTSKVSQRLVHVVIENFGPTSSPLQDPVAVMRETLGNLTSSRTALRTLHPFGLPFHHPDTSAHATLERHDKQGLIAAKVNGNVCLRLVSNQQDTPALRGTKCQ